VNDKGIPRQGYEIFSGSGEKIGIVTSGTHSPNLDKGIGMGYIDNPYNKKDSEVFIQIRRNLIPCTIVSTPFI
jgi:aminomethyltransferase